MFRALALRQSKALLILKTPANTLFTAFSIFTSTLRWYTVANTLLVGCLYRNKTRAMTEQRWLQVQLLWGVSPLPLFVLEVSLSTWSELVCSANQHPKSTIKKKSPQTFAHIGNFSKQCVCPSYNLAILTIQISHVLAAWSAFRALFTWSWRTTCANDHRLFILITHKSTRWENPIAWLLSRISFSLWCHLLNLLNAFDPQGGAWPF